MERLSDVLVDIARTMFDADTVDEVLDAVVRGAPRAVPGCSGAAIVVVQRDQAVVAAASDEVAREVEAAEAELGDGPCLEALRDHVVISSSDLETEVRWPRWGRVATDNGYASMLGFRLYAGPRSLGALDLFSPTRNAFDTDAEAAGLALAAHAAIAFANALNEIDAASEAQGLRNALMSRDVIGQAKGILMHQCGISADDAFERLRVVSQHRNVPLRAIAEEVARTGDLPT